MSSGYWFVDASSIDVSNFDFEKYIAKTTRVSDFLDLSKYVIVGPKGYGKTLLLKYLYHKIGEKFHGQSIVSIPSNTCIDSFEYRIPYEGKLIDVLSNIDIWQDLWQISLGTSIIINYSIATQDYDFLSEFKKSWIENNVKFTNIISLIEKVEIKIKNKESVPGYVKIQANPSSLLGNILSLSIGNIQSSITTAVDKTYQWSLSVDRPVNVFIDQIDQGISEFPIEVWQCAQNGLVGAIFKLITSRHVRIYASIRKEAWDSCQDELHGQYYDIVSELTYNEKDLKDIFEHAVKTYESADTVKKPEKYELSPIEAFTGLKTVKNVWSDVGENSFTYMLRHTLRRPRDLIMFGKEISRLSRDNDLSEENFRESVNRIPGEEIQKQYLKEVARFTHCLQYTNIERFFSNVKRNILTKNEIIEICGKYNNHLCVCIAKNGGQCKDCKESSHMFCDLYRIGLVGIVGMKETKENEFNLQHFESTGKIGAIFLPRSNYYILHPALDHFIKEILEHRDYSPVKGAIVGHNEKWTDKHKALVCLSDIEKIITTHESYIGFDEIVNSYKQLNKTLTSNSDKNVMLSCISKFKDSVTSEGLIAASTFSVNIINSVDKLFRLVQNI